MSTSHTGGTATPRAGELPEQYSEEHLELGRAEFQTENLSEADMEKIKEQRAGDKPDGTFPVSYTHLRAHETN